MALNIYENNTIHVLLEVIPTGQTTPTEVPSMMILLMVVHTFAKPQRIMPPSLNHNKKQL